MRFCLTTIRRLGRTLRKNVLSVPKALFISKSHFSYEHILFIKIADDDNSKFSFLCRARQLRVLLVFVDQFFQKRLVPSQPVIVYQLKHVECVAKLRNYWYKHIILIILWRVRDLRLLFFKVEELKVGISDCSVKIGETLNVIEQ